VIGPDVGWSSQHCHVGKDLVLNALACSFFHFAGSHATRLVDWFCGTVFKMLPQGMSYAHFNECFSFVPNFDDE
jgi:hypothetical protein